MGEVRIPSDPEAEGMLLAAAVLNRLAWQAFAAVDPDDFYLPVHRRLADVIRELGPGMKLECDLRDPERARWLPPTLTGPDRTVLAHLIDDCPTPLYALRWRERVEAAARRRRILTATAEVYNTAADDPDALQRLSRELSGGT